FCQRLRRGQLQFGPHPGQHSDNRNYRRGRPRRQRPLLHHQRLFESQHLHPPPRSAGGAAHRPESRRLPFSHSQPAIPAPRTFPTASGTPLSAALSNRRQDSGFNTLSGYFTNNPLGPWTAVFVSYTPAAFNTPAGQKALAALAAKNGRDLDGTPIIRTPMELD